MTGKQENRDAIIRLADALVEDVLNTSDDEILAEAHEDAVDVELWLAPAGRNSRALPLRLPSDGSQRRKLQLRHSVRRRP